MEPIQPIQPYFNISVERNTKGHNYALDVKHCPDAATANALAADAINEIRNAISMAILKIDTPTL